MFFALFVITVLFGSSEVITFVLHPPKEAPIISAVSHYRCQDGSLQTLRKSLLEALNLQTEPRLPAGMVDSVREQWHRTSSSISQGALNTAASELSGNFVSPDSGNSTSLKCCSMASEVFMKDLGWDSWVIHPLSLTIVHCALCSSADKTVKCPSSSSSIQDTELQNQLPCCQPTSQEMVPIVYMDETSTIVISSVHFTRSCGCEPANQPGNAQQPTKE